MNGLDLYICEKRSIKYSIKEKYFLLRNISDICKGSLNKIISDDTIYYQISSNLEFKCQKSFFNDHL